MLTSFGAGNEERRKRAREHAEQFAATYGVSLEESRAARIGANLIYCGLMLETLMPVFIILTTIALTGVSAIAQTPGGGTFFGQNDQTVGRGIVEAIKWGRNLLFVLGVLFFMWIPFNVGFDMSWKSKAIGGIGCFGFGGLAALGYSWANGQATNFDTNLGN